jgi:hypothetical protein
LLKYRKIFAVNVKTAGLLVIHRWFESFNLIYSKKQKDKKGCRQIKKDDSQEKLITAKI